jgi:hypothetical protein
MVRQENKFKKSIKISGSMIALRNRRRSPYWNFWRVVLAGWTIRYPKTMGKIIFLPLGFLIVLIYNAIVK